MPRERIVGAVRRGAVEHFPVEIGRRIAVRRAAEAGHEVAEVVRLDRDDLSELAVADELPGTFEVGPGAVLGADLDNALVLLGGFDHPAALLDEEAEGFLDVDVLAGGAGEHGHQPVPMVGRGDDDGVDVFVVEHLAEVGVSFRVCRRRVRRRDPCAAEGFGDAGDLDIGLLDEGRGEDPADEADADDADVDAFIGPEDATGGERGQAHGAAGDKRAAGHRIRRIRASFFVPRC